MRNAKGKKEGEEGANHLKGRRWLIEVTFVWGSKWEKRETAKIVKYELLVERLKQIGWEVEFRVLGLGVTGITRDLFTESHIRGFGLNKVRCMLLEKNIARSSWGYVSSLRVSIRIAFNAWEAGVDAGGGSDTGGGEART